MLIDWFTVGAQAVNFLILVWLLKRFLYRPILDAIAAREKKVADTLRDAATKQAAALGEREAYRLKNEEIDKQRDALLSKATSDAQTERQRLLQQAKAEVSDLRARLGDGLRTEQQALSGEIARKVRIEVFAYVERILTDLASTSLEERMGRVFIERLGSLSGADRAVLAATAKATSGVAVIRSAFDLLPAQQALITAALSQAAGVDMRPRFETATELLSGIELTAGGQRLAWTLADYLTTLKAPIPHAEAVASVG
jgi:F-type H+-transporting ATPase subunit b